MDLGIQGKKAIVCASTRGLGFACAESLAREGVDVVINGRSHQTVDEAVDRLRASAKTRIAGVVADIATPEGREHLLATCPDPDILINNNAGPPPGKLDDWDRPKWLHALERNFIAAALLIRAVLPGMCDRRFGRIVNITSAMVKSPRGPMGLSTAARAALTAFSKSVSFDAAACNVTINNLLPERIDTGRQKFMADLIVEQKGISFEEARHEIAQTIAAKRFGLPGEFGDACAYLCSAQAGFISGQNLQLDGGSYPGLI